MDRRPPLNGWRTRGLGDSRVGSPTISALGFDSGDSVRYELPRRTRVKLEAPRQAGSWTLEWDASDGASRRVGNGVYFIRLSTPGGARVEKVVLAG